MKKVIIIHGPITHPNQIIDCYKEMDVIFSTTDKDLAILSDSGFTIVQNEPPKISGTANFNYQVVNTFNGLKIAKQMGFNFVFKIRSDITIPKIEDLLQLMGEEKDKIFFPAYHDWHGGYLCDHMQYGNIDEMLKLWEIQESNSESPPETQLTTHFLKHLQNIKVEYIFPLLYEYNILAYWEKRKFFLNSYQNDKLFRYDKFKT